MGLFSKRITDDEWLRDFLPLAKRVSKQWGPVNKAYLDLSFGRTNIRPISQELAKQSSMAQAIRRLPSPASSEASRIKSDYDSFLKDKLELNKLRAELALAVIRIQGGPYSSSDLDKVDILQARADQLEIKNRQRLFGGVEEFLNEHGISGV